MESRSTGRPATAAWPSCARRTAYRSSCCRRARRCLRPNPGPPCLTSVPGSQPFTPRGRPRRRPFTTRDDRRDRSEHFRGARRLDVDLGARGNVVAGDHFVIRLSRTHHGIDAGIGIDHDLEEGWTAETNELAEDARDVCLLVEPGGVLEAVRLRRL